MAQGSIYRLTYVQAQNDVRFSNVIAFRQTTANGANDPRKDLADAFIAGPGLQLSALLSDQWNERCIQIREVALAGQDFYRVLTAEQGALALEPLPSEVCGQIKLFTGTAGRGTTGRLFISGIPANREEDNCLLESYCVAFDNFIQFLVTGVSAGGATFEAGLLRGNGSFLPFLSGTMKSALTVQRSRKQPIIC